MSDNSKIQWTDTTWNVVTGCTKVSPGCTNCYIERTPPMRKAGRKFEYISKDEGVTTGVLLHPDRLEKPLHWKKPRRVFVNSMSDLFHEDVPHDFILSVFAVMAACPQHTFQILTKRPERLAELSWHMTPDRILNEFGHRLTGRALDAPWPLPNVHLGVSVENQHWADKRIPLLLQTPAAVRFVSYEPALGPVNFACLEEGADALTGFWSHYDEDTGEPCDHWDKGLDWVIVGGESGPNARPFNIEWARSTIAQCKAAGVPVFVKQLGKRPYEGKDTMIKWLDLKDSHGGDWDEWPSDLRVREFPGERV